MRATPSPRAVWLLASFAGTQGSFQFVCTNPAPVNGTDLADGITGVINIAGALDLNHSSTSVAGYVDVSTVAPQAFLQAYGAWARHVNGHEVGGVLISGKRFLVNITVCLDYADVSGGGGATSPSASPIQNLYRAFACGCPAGSNGCPEHVLGRVGAPQIDYLLGPFGTARTTKALEAVIDGGAQCKQPLFLAAGSAGDQVFKRASDGNYSMFFSPHARASSFVEPWLQLLATQPPERVSNQGQLRTDTADGLFFGVVSGPLTNNVKGAGGTETTTQTLAGALHDGITRRLPINCWDYSDVQAISAGDVYIAMPGCRDSHSPGEVRYCQAARESGAKVSKTTWENSHSGIRHRSWTRDPKDGCGVWHLGFCGGPGCVGNSSQGYRLGNESQVLLDQQYTLEQGEDVSDRAVQEVLLDLTRAFDMCSSVNSRATSSSTLNVCELDVLIGLGHESDFERFTRVFGTMEKSSRNKLPNLALMMGANPTTKMEADPNQYYFKDWCSAVVWDKHMGYGDGVPTRYLGNSSEFASFMKQELHDCSECVVSDRHAMAAAALVMLHMALELPNVTAKNDSHGIRQAMLSLHLNSSTKESFFGAHNITKDGGWQNRAVPAVSTIAFSLFSRGFGYLYVSRQRDTDILCV
jgi:hypothetical protein